MPGLPSRLWAWPTRMTTSSWAPGRPAACWPTAYPPTRQSACCCWRPAALTCTLTSARPPASSRRSRAPASTGATRRSRLPERTTGRSTFRAARFWRLERHQRQPLCAGAAAGFRHLGAARQSRLVVRRRPAVFPPLGGPVQRRGRLPWHRRPAARVRHQRTAPDLRSLHRWRREPGRAAQPRLQRRRAGRRSLLPAHHPQRPPPQRRHRLPGAGSPPPEPSYRDRRTRAASRYRASPGDRRHLPPGRPRAPSHRRRRGDPVCRRRELASLAAALGHWPGGASAKRRHRAAARSARRRRRSAGPLCHSGSAPCRAR